MTGTRVWWDISRADLRQRTERVRAHAVLAAQSGVAAGLAAGDAPSDCPELTDLQRAAGVEPGEAERMIRRAAGTAGGRTAPRAGGR